MNPNTITLVRDSELESVGGGNWLLEKAVELYIATLPTVIGQYSKPGGEGRIPGAYRR